MLTLSATTDTIEVKLTAAHATAALQCVASWRDITTSAYTPGRTLIDTNGTTSVIAVAAPAASTQRVIDALSVINNDTVPHYVTVSFDANATEYVVFRGLVAPGHRLSYEDRLGWRVVSDTGATLAAVEVLTPATQATAGSKWAVLVLGKDVVNDHATADTLKSLSELSLLCSGTSKYWFRYTLFYTAAATTTGSRFSVSFRTEATVVYRNRRSLTTTSVTSSENASTDDGGSLVNTTSASTDANCSVVEGYITMPYTGLLVPRFSSEVAGSAITIKRGSFLEYITV